jgi:hypothetical protein
MSGAGVGLDMKACLSDPKVTDLKTARRRGKRRKYSVFTFYYHQFIVVKVSGIEY